MKNINHDCNIVVLVDLLFSSRSLRASVRIIYGIDYVGWSGRFYINRMGLEDGHNMISAIILGGTGDNLKGACLNIQGKKLPFYPQGLHLKRLAHLSHSLA